MTEASLKNKTLEQVERVRTPKNFERVEEIDGSPICSARRQAAARRISDR